MEISYYEIIFNAETGAFGIACNSREFQISSALASANLVFNMDVEKKTLILKTSGEDIKYLDIPEKFLIPLSKVPKILFMCGLPSPYDDEPPEVEGLATALNEQKNV